MAPGSDSRVPVPSRRRLSSSIAVRILLAFAALMTVATVVSVILVRQVLFAGLDGRIDSDLVQESRELTRLARGNDPDTGEPFGTDVRRILEVFFQRNVPARNEALLSFVGGELFVRSRNVLPYRLDEDDDLVRRWVEASDVQMDAVQTPGGTVRYLAMPVQVSGRTEAVFVAAVFRDLEAESIQPAVRAAGFVGLGALLVGSLLAFLVARRIIDRVQAVEFSARSISESDLSRRVEVSGSDEIAHLAQTFNDLLDRLEGAFRAQRAFVDDAGHELRTPITIIRGQLEVLGDDPRQREHAVALVTSELDRMSRMVNDLLLLAKAEQPQFLEFDLVDVGSLTRRVNEKAGALADRDWRVDEIAGGAIVGDGERLEQALIQLLQNAVDHTPDGAEIAVGSRIRDGVAELWVRDAGPGIPPEERERIFERFARAGVRRSEGVGLGLAIVRAIAEGHGGRVRLDSEVGVGTTIRIEVPVDHGAGAELPEEREDGPAEPS